MSINMVATIQARMGSTRLPGKVLKNICGKPMLLWQIERLKNSRLIDQIIVATTTSSKDDEIVEFCNTNQIKYFRGSENDVLSRICDLIKKYNIDLHLEFHGDSPLVDFQIVDEYIGYFLKNINKIDYLSNSLKTSYPPGLEFSIYKSSVLLEVNNLINSKDKYREHVGFNITRFKEKYQIKCLLAQEIFNYPNIYLEVDTAEDLEVIRKIFSYFKSSKTKYFDTHQIIEMLLDNKKIIEINNKVERRWKKFRES